MAGRLTRSQSSKTAIREARRRAEMMRLRVEGLTLAEIAERMGVDKSTVSRVIKRGLENTVQQPADELRALELERCESLWAEAMRIVKQFRPLLGRDGQVLMVPMLTPEGVPVLKPDGAALTVAAEDVMPKLGAINTALKVAERRARLLGLDAPQRVQQQVAVDGARELPDFSHLSVEELEAMRDRLHPPQHQHCGQVTEMPELETGLVNRRG